MLPHVSPDNLSLPAARKVYINPNFHNRAAQSMSQQNNYASHEMGGAVSTHQTSLNPPAIHINPYFLQQQQQQQYQLYYLQQLQLQEQQRQQMQQVPYCQSTSHHLIPKIVPTPAKIIQKASTTVVRKPIVLPSERKPAIIVPKQAPLISKTKRKIVRQSTSAKAVIAPKLIKLESPTTKRTKYKLVRSIPLTSSSTPLIKKRRVRDFVGRYALQRGTEASPTQKLSHQSHAIKGVGNKSLCMVSIHGVMYKKSAKNKLTKLDANAGLLAKHQVTLSNPLKQSVEKSGRTLFVHGTRFVLDPTGCRLTRLPENCNQSVLRPKVQPSSRIVPRQRIDIGGLTYVASSTKQNIYIRTTDHVSRAHLMTAKHRSLQLLNRSLAKTNIPCAIFQRLGKCAAFGRGKCRKLHDKRQVAICPRFLRGECTKTECLLSHNVSLAKMPVCKYYLRGACVREDCPYLHKKLSHKTEICIDFLRGFCERAAECNKRHEFMCPEIARRGKCEAINCAFCKQVRKINATRTKSNAEQKTKVETAQPVALAVAAADKAEEPIQGRYFKCDDSAKASSLPRLETETTQESDEEDTESADKGRRQRPKLGILPAFIPLGPE